MNQGVNARLHLGAIAIGLKVASRFCLHLSKPVRIGVPLQGPAETANLKLKGPPAVVDAVPEIAELLGGLDLGFPGSEVIGTAWNSRPMRLQRNKLYSCPKVPCSPSTSVPAMPAIQMAAA